MFHKPQAFTRFFYSRGGPPYSSLSPPFPRDQILSSVQYSPTHLHPLYFFGSAKDGATEWPLKGQALAGVVASHSACLSLSGWLLPSHRLRQHLSAVTELPGLTNPRLVPLAAPEHGV